jgi:hypothetical protein
MQRPWIVPTPGTRLERLEENIGAVGVELTPEDLQEIESAAASITVQGARYPEQISEVCDGKKVVSLVGDFRTRPSLDTSEQLYS